MSKIVQLYDDVACLLAVDKEFNYLFHPFSISALCTLYSFLSL